MRLTFVENRQLDRAHRYTVYLNDAQDCVELGCGPTRDDAIREAEVALIVSTRLMVQRHWDTEVIEAPPAAPARRRDDDRPDRALTLNEYVAKHCPDLHITVPGDPLG